jgi:hypothetical protein
MAPYKTEEESNRPTYETKSDFVEKYVLRPVGKLLTKEYRVYLNLNDKLVSLFSLTGIERSIDENTTTDRKRRVPQSPQAGYPGRPVKVRSQHLSA